MTGVALRAVRADGTPCVLKLRFPEEGEPATEGAALRHYGGGAAVTLIADDMARCALLLERCTPGTPLLDEPDDFATTVIAGLLAELWSPPPVGHPFGTLASVAERWVATIAASAAFDRSLRDETVGLLRELVADAGSPVVLHTDLHAGNVLRAERRRWLAIDPKGLVGERAFDCAALLRDRATADRVPRRLAIVTELLGVDPARVRGWALAQSVEGAVWSYRTGDMAGGDAFASAARLIAALPR